ncbi:alpha/beta hydrolase [Actibacterium lipolyticum]|uniref:Alpha/beta hydrolase n=1 Tax=Actibacterium lipolyticum TaxID=1524263 RepID=A0A238KKP0_9RHOB|nr:alpha/beta hydrolase [Actibacterium lipolyticum]SMX43321.1 hypothetical protein COL8621_02272 [Actibacterium lipolyticum]
MPLVKINAVNDLPAPANGGDLKGVLADAFHRVPRTAPVIVLIHGFKFSPFQESRSPHEHILSLSPKPKNRRAISWPTELGFTDLHPNEGLCISFGWDASGHIWRACANAEHAGKALAQLTAIISQLRPGQRVDVMTHSLGARVTLSGMAQMPPRALRRVVLMTPAEMTSRARAALDTPAGQCAEFLNITSRENDLYDLMFEGLVAPHRPGDRALGQGGFSKRRNWLDLQIDHPDTLEGLARIGLHIAPPSRRVCHWSPYLRPGMFDLYRAFLREGMPLTALRNCVPEGSSRRWSRLLAPPRVNLPLPFVGKTPS